MDGDYRRDPPEDFWGSLSPTMRRTAWMMHRIVSHHHSCGHHITMDRRFVSPAAAVALYKIAGCTLSGTWNVKYGLPLCLMKPKISKSKLAEESKKPPTYYTCSVNSSAVADAYSTKRELSELKLVGASFYDNAPLHMLFSNPLCSFEAVAGGVRGKGQTIRYDFQHKYVL